MGKKLSKVKVIFLPLPKVTQISKLKLGSFEIVGSFETKFYVEAYGRIGMKIYSK